ncbi:MAG: hypothetical protein IJJ47_09205 [Methanosphaera sp.]|nr:hypothetical protein [Methanosphaera sp.]
MSLITKIKNKFLESSNSYIFYKSNYEKLHRIVKEKDNALKISNKTINEKDNALKISNKEKDKLLNILQKEKKIHNELKSINKSIQISNNDTAERLLFLEKNVNMLDIHLENTYDKLYNLNINQYTDLNDYLLDLKDILINSNLANYEKIDSSFNSQQLLINHSLNEMSNSINSLIKSFYNMSEDFDLFENNIIKQKKSTNEIINLHNQIIEEFNSYKYNTIFKHVDEIRYAMVFNDTIKNSTWLKNQALSLNNGASNYSFMYILYRILNEIKPKNILELGLGQTSLMTSSYVQNSGNKLTIIESNQEWIESFSNKMHLSNNMNIKQVDIERFNFDNSENLRYKNLKSVLQDDKFDLIIIDGPQGFDHENNNQMLKYSRSNIWDLISNLEDDFIIIVDDYERQGERNTVKRLFNLLDSQNIDYYFNDFRGAKHQLVICSKKYKFLIWF